MKGFENIIIGGGAIGLRCASQLKEGNTAVIEEHEAIGRPVQCTGIVTESIKDAIGIKNNVIVNKVNLFRIKANGRVAEFKLKKTNIVFDREAFDLMLKDEAEDKGVKILTSHRYISNHNNETKILNKKSNTNICLAYKNLIGADGPFSNVAKNNGIYTEREIIPGIQFKVSLKKSIDKNAVEIYPREGEFGWLLPEDEKTARIGMVVRKNSRSAFDSFLKKEGLKDNIKKIIEWQSGVVPYYNPEIIFQNANTFLIGDSAAMIKNTSSGGLLHGLKSANILAGCLNKNKPEEYTQILKKQILPDLKLHYRIRNIMNRLKDNDWKYLMDTVNKDKIKTILEKFDRDYPGKYLFRMLLNEPKLLYLIKYLI